MLDVRLLDDADALAALVPDGAWLAVPKDTSGVAMAATRALVRREARGLALTCLPQSGIQADLLIGAEAVATVETAGVTLGEYGQAPAFGRAVRDGRIVLKDSTCPAIYAGFQAGEKGLPFIPLRGLIGSDILRHRRDYKVIDNPFGQDDPVVLLPPIAPDVTLFHAPKADRHGNVYVGRERDLILLAHAARQCLVTVEEIVEDDLLADPLLAPATLPSLYVTAIAPAERGAWPLALPQHYAADDSHLREYARLAATEQGFAAYLALHVAPRRAAAE